MRKQTKPMVLQRLLSLALALTMLMALLPAGALSAHAAEADPASTYYLVGYINGADYGCNGDWANLGEYKFENGKLTATFTQDSYVFVKTGDNNGWFMSDTYCEGTTVTLKNTSNGTSSEKMKVPGNAELTFTLTANGDGTLTLSYEKKAAATPDPKPQTKDIKLHIQNTQNWEVVNVHLWNTVDSNSPGWPGVALTTVNALNEGWYDLSITVNQGTAAGGVLNNLAPNDKGELVGVQTGDITIPEADEVWITVGDPENGKHTTAAVTTAPENWVTKAPVDPAASAYYLVGYINGADYGCNGDYANLGEYKFVDGKLIATFEQDSYVFVKTGDNQGWYMADAYCEDTTVTLKNTANSSASEKMKVPGGKELEFTLVSNADDTLTLSYAEVPEDPASTYYLVGYINGADYGCNGDYANLGEYKFVGGKLTAAFEQDSYVFVKTGDNNGWYMADAYSEGTSVTLKNTANSSASEKLKVPGGRALDFVLTVNGDDTLTLAYTAQEAPSTYTYTIHYANPDKWETVNAYAWYGNNVNPLGSWPGTAAAANKDNEGWYDVTVTAEEDTIGLIFNNGNNAQTSDLNVKVPAGSDSVEAWITNEVSTTAPENWAVPGYEVALHFLKSEGWGNNINAWVWDNGGSIPGYEDYHATWPGKQIPANTAHEGWYDLTIVTTNASGFNFIFNDGGNQTSDLATGALTGNTELWVIGDTVYKLAPGEWDGVYSYDVAIHFHNTASWTTVNAKFGQGDSWEPIPGFENYKDQDLGAAMEKNAANPGWYTVSVKIVGNDAAINGVFNNGAWGENNQTANWTTGTLNPGANAFWYDNGELTQTMPNGWFDPNLNVFVPGTFPGPSWDAASNKMTYDPELGLYVYTFKNVPPANYQFKIAINGSWKENYGLNGEPDGGNIPVTVMDTRDVTVYYNSRSHRAVTDVDYVFADITLSGTGIPQDTKMTDPDLTGYYTVKVAMTAGTYQDVTLTYDGKTFTFTPFELKTDKEVTFYFDPSTGIYYHDGSEEKVSGEYIYYNSKDLAYKSPFGAVPQGSDVTFTIDTGDDAIDVKLLVRGLGSFDMAQPELTAYELGIKKWTCTVNFARMGEYDYYFAVSNGSDVKFYGDDDGYYGTGRVTDMSGVMEYDLVVYKAGYETPDWMKNAVIYQIFPDRFFDGDPSNNLAQLTARGAVNYEYISNWYTLPENPEQEELLKNEKDVYLSTGAHWGDHEWSNEIYGGDLEGIAQKIPYLKALGVNVIYLNPVFSSISNHRYDACDYTKIDPILGTQGDFDQLVSLAHANGMKVVLDGVFNHVSDDSIYFDRYYKYLGKSEKIGAYPYWAYVYDYMAEKNVNQAAAETAARSYFSQKYHITDYSYTEWFAVLNTPMTGTVDSIGDRAGKPVYSYEGWWGYDSMPVIKSTNGSEYQTGNWGQEIIGNSSNTSVTQYWITKGNDGWRLDVANEVSDETWQHFRSSVKALNSGDVVIIGEIWDDATKYLMGDMYDSVMNYLFRNAVTEFAMGKADAQATTNAMERIRERYPEEAFYAMMNLVGSHDTTRILSYLDGITDDRDQKDLKSAFPTYAGTSAEAKARQYLVAFLQFTYPGAPTIYYGDEIGMVGSDDPDDRRAMEWGKGNKELVEWYAKLAATRNAYSALRTGDLNPIATGSSNLMGYTRSLDGKTVIVVANNSASSVEYTPAAGYGVAFTDVITGTVYGADAKSYTVPAYCGIVLVPTDEVVDVTVNYSDLKPAYDASFTVGARDTDHKHSYTHTVVYPTCTEEGYTIHECSCGERYSDTYTKPVGHSSGKLVKHVAATCTKDGYYDYRCEVCNEVYRVVEKATGHGELELKNEKKPTCTKTGYTGDKVCTVCKQIVEKGEKIAKAPHNFKDGVCTVCKTTNPGTGDTFNMTLYIVLMVVAAAGIVVLIVVFTKKKKK